jgi:hypothetical protein
MMMHRLVNPKNHSPYIYLTKGVQDTFWKEASVTDSVISPLS